MQNCSTTVPDGAVECCGDGRAATMRLFGRCAAQLRVCSCLRANGWTLWHNGMEVKERAEDEDAQLRLWWWWCACNGRRGGVGGKKRAVNSRPNNGNRRDCGELLPCFSRGLVHNGKSRGICSENHVRDAARECMAHAMLRLSSSICPFCEASAFLRYRQPSCIQQRNASTLQKRKPSRMTLSANVKRGPPQRPSPTPTATAKPSGRPRDVRKSRNNPFGGMNVTSAPRQAEALRNKVSAAEQRRQARNVKGAVKKADDKSRDPMKALKMQRRLSNVSYEKRGRIKESIAERDEFEDLGLMQVVQQSIKSQGLGLSGGADAVPSPIQRVAIPALLGLEEKKGRRGRLRDQSDGMQEFLLAAETGSGKTLAYVLPIVNAIKQAEQAARENEALEAEREERQRTKQSKNRLFQVEPPDTNEPDPSSARPRAIILVPTSELVDQVGSVIKSLSHTVKFRSALLSSNYSGRVIRSRLFSTKGIDVVISTPHLLASITESDPNILSRVSHLVIDEADSLLDRSFSPVTSSIIDRASPSLQQLIFCSATIPRSLDSYLSKRFPETRRLVTPNLHAIPRRVQLSVVDIEKVPYQGNRNLACAQVIWDIGKEGAEEGEGRSAKKILVFVNEREKTEELAQYLRGKGIEALALSRDSSDRQSAEALAAFTGLTALSRVKDPDVSSHPLAISPADLSHPSRPSVKQLSNTKVLISTDLSSRGIDTLPLKHVILYDVPHTSIDFIHRLGRVGRMGRRGRGVVLVGKGDRRDVVAEVRGGMFRGQALI